MVFPNVRTMFLLGLLFLGMSMQAASHDNFATTSISAPSEEIGGIPLTESSLKLLTVTGVVIAAVIAFCASLFSALLTGWLTLKRMEHDRSEARAERTFEAKKTAFLSAAEILSESLVVLSKVADISISLPDYNKLYAELKLGAEVSKTNIVAGLETIEHTTEFMSKYADATFDLMERRLLFEKTKLANPNFNPVPGMLEMLEVYMEHIYKMTPVLADALIALRKEIDLSVDEKKYRELTYRVVTANQQRISKFIGALRDLSSPQS